MRERVELEARGVHGGYRECVQTRSSPKVVSRLQARALPLRAAVALTALHIDQSPHWPAPPRSLHTDNEETGSPLHDTPAGETAPATAGRSERPRRPELAEKLCSRGL
jgi:hypothetical protein